ncbi:MAG TPA: ferritin [Spirochaetia bacterium]|nr:ferritin [Spirochaetales bacterium]HRY72280.1 ferritin [Spirochaetia bacterium]
MISKKMSDRINLQINREMFSAYLYMAMSARMAEAGYKGIANWLMIQYHEEMFHAMKLYGYLEDQGAAVALEAIAKPEFKETGVKELFRHVLEHEKGVTASIREIAALAREEKDYATESFIAWYVGEQVEEEKNAADILQTLDLLGDSAQGTFMLNIELGKRKLGVPSDFTAMGGGD